MGGGALGLAALEDSRAISKGSPTPQTFPHALPSSRQKLSQHLARITSMISTHDTLSLWIVQTRHLKAEARDTLKDIIEFTEKLLKAMNANPPASPLRL